MSSSRFFVFFFFSPEWFSGRSKANRQVGVVPPDKRTFDYQFKRKTERIGRRTTKAKTI